MRRSLWLVPLLLLAGVALFGFWLVHALNGMASLEPGMIELHLPSGATAYVRRQAYFNKPADVYISGNNNFCKPSSRLHDYKLPEPIHGAPSSPLLISYSGDTIIVHSPNKPQSPLFSDSSSFKVTFQELSSKDYEAYAAPYGRGIGLPTGWLRIEIPLGHNTCAL